MSKKYSENEITIRPAKKEDMSAVAKMIQELADFENMPNGPRLTVEDLERDGFCSTPPLFLSVVAEVSGGVVGYAMYFHIYSTWQGRAMMLEDLYVRQTMRGQGVGRRLFNAVAKAALQEGCARLDFHVLEWNPARRFYEGLGADNLTSDQQWCYYRLAGSALTRAAADTDVPPSPPPPTTEHVHA